MVPHGVNLQLCFITAKSGSAREIFHACNFFAESRCAIYSWVFQNSRVLRNHLISELLTPTIQNPWWPNFVNANPNAWEKPSYEPWCLRQQAICCSNHTHFPSQQFMITTLPRFCMERAIFGKPDDSLQQMSADAQSAVSLVNLLVGTKAKSTRWWQHCLAT